MSKYQSIAAYLTFIPVAVETLCPMGPEATSFLLDLGRRLRQHTGGPRSTSYLIQRSQWRSSCNAVAHGKELDELHAAIIVLHVIVLSIVLYVLHVWFCHCYIIYFFIAYNNCIILLSCSVFYLHCYYTILYIVLYSSYVYIILHVYIVIII